MPMEIQISDAVHMRDDTKKIRSLVHSDMLYVSPVLHEKLVEYVNAHELTERSIFGELSDRLIRLNTAAWSDFEPEVARIRQDPELDDEQRRRVEQEFRQNIEKSSLRELDALKTLQAGQQSSLLALRRFTLNGEALEESAAHAVEKLDSSLEQARQAYEAQKTRKAELDVLVEAFGQNGLGKVFKNLIPTPEQIDAATQILESKAVDVAALKEIAKTLERNVDVLTEGRQYANVVATRDYVRRVLETQLKELQTLEEVRNSKQRELEQTRLLPALNQLREQWLSEAEKIPAGLQLHLASFGQRLTVEQVCEGVLAIAAYLKAIRARYDGF